MQLLRAARAGHARHDQAMQPDGAPPVSRPDQDKASPQTSPTGPGRLNQDIQPVLQIQRDQIQKSIQGIQHKKARRLTKRQYRNQGQDAYRSNQIHECYFDKLLPVRSPILPLKSPLLAASPQSSNRSGAEQQRSVTKADGEAQKKLDG